MGNPRKTFFRLSSARRSLRFHFVCRLFLPSASMVEAQANQTEEVQAAFANYNETIQAEMMKIDPEISEKMDRKDALMEEFRNLRNAIPSR
jgi:hypothetical protein